MNHSFPPKALKGIILILFGVIITGCTAESEVDTSYIREFSPENNFFFFPISSENFRVCHIGKQRNYGPSNSVITESIAPSLTNTTTPYETKIYNKIEIPKKDDIDYSLIISVIAVIASIGIPLYTSYKERRESKIDEYWMREVILPKINDLLFPYVTSLIEAFINFDGKPNEFNIYFRNKYLAEQGTLRDSFGMLASLINNPNIANELEDICDELDQRIVNNIDENINIRKKDAYWFQQELIKKLAVCHNMA